MLGFRELQGGGDGTRDRLCSVLSRAESQSKGPEDDGAPAVPDIFSVHSQLNQDTGKGRKMGYRVQMSGIGRGEGGN